MNKEPFERLAQLQTEKAVLEEQIEAARVDVALEMKKHKADKVDAPYGTFYFTPRNKWVYSENVKKLEALLKADKKVEEEKGIAQVETTLSLTYRPRDVVGQSTTQSN